MSDTPNWHDAHALMLIDQALECGRFTEDLVREITEALDQARSAPSTVSSAAAR